MAVKVIRAQNVLRQIDGPWRCGDSERARSEEGIVVPLSGLSFHDGWFSEQRREGRRRKGWSESQSYSSDSWAGLKASTWVV